MLVLPKGVRHMPGYLAHAAQQALVEEIRDVVQRAPLYTPAMPRTGKEMSVRMTNCGSLGWVTDKERGYRYQPTHPVTGEPWPPIPESLLRLWREVAGYPHPPQACLVNFYSDTRRWACTRTATKPISRRRWSRSRWATIACSVSASTTRDGPHRIFPAGERRCRRARRRRPALLPRRRPHLSRRPRRC